MDASPDAKAKNLKGDDIGDELDKSFKRVCVKGMRCKAQSKEFSIKNITDILSSVAEEVDIQEIGRAAQR